MGKGALVFKGDKPKGKKKRKKSKHSSATTTSRSGATASVHNHDDTHAVAAAIHGGPSHTTPVPAAASAAPPQIEDGIGRISTSGTVMTGQGTKFLKSLRSGDAILVNIGGMEEMRVLTMVVSDVSAALSTPFSVDVKIPAEFKYIQKPRNVAKERADAAKKIKVTKEEEERSAFGLYGTGTEFVYRETTEHGSYRIKREKIDGNVTRGDLLERRTKKKSDKYC